MDLASGLRSYFAELERVAAKRAMAEGAIQSYAAERTLQMLKDTAKEFGPIQNEMIRSIFSDAADEFYAAYSAFAYSRRYSLYEIYSPKFTAEGMVAYDSPSDESLYDKSKPSSRGGGSLFDLVVKQGFHGGATGTDSSGESRSAPSYRRPIPTYYAWGGYAVSTTPMIELVAEKLASAEGGKIFDAYKDVLYRQNEKMVSDINNKWNELMK